MSDEPKSQFPVTTIVIAAIVIILIPFVPLLLAGIEHLTTGTNRVEDLCQMMGIHDELSGLYRFVLSPCGL